MKLKIFLCICLFGLAAPAFGAVRGAYHNHFAIELDYVLMRRSNSMNKHLVSAAGGPLTIPVELEPPECAKEAGKVLLNSRDLIHNMHYNSGFSAAIKIFPSIYSTWEARYLGGLAWEGKRVRNCPENLNLDGSLAFQTVDYNFASHVKTIYLSKMFTPELNYWRHVTPRYTDHFSVSWMIGLRYFDIGEKIKLYFTKPPQTSRFRTRVEDRSFGLQIGGDIEYNPYHFLTWGLVAKVGGLYNRNKQKTLMLDDDNTMVILDHHRSGSSFAYVAQAYPFIELRPSKFFFFHFNYQVLYIGNIATASSNLKFHGTKSILNHGGHILYHGATGGIQFNF